MSLTVDIQPLLTSVQNNLGWVMAILGIPAGIGIAVVIVRYIIEEFRKAF